MKKILLFGIPMSICNFRCHYCYLSQREVAYKGIQPHFRFSPEEVARAMTTERLGGECFMNFCADGETLLTKNIDQYIKLLVANGHYAEIVTNLTPTKVLEKILAWDTQLLERVEFKCSFHYLELKKRKLLSCFVDNVHKIWKAGASANIEVTPSDELIPYIDELMEFSIHNFGALPQLTIARNDRTSGIEILTKLSDEEYVSTWSQFDSNFWQFKKTLFNVKRAEFCYAGAWSLYINLATGGLKQCYWGAEIGNAFSNPDKPLFSFPIGKCKIAHCYNGHALLSTGLIPSMDTPGYGDLRDRTKTDGQHWLQPALRDFFNTKLVDSNKEMCSTVKFFAPQISAAINYLSYLKKKLRRIK